jgi:predicted HTH domain antitoxin
MPQKATVPYPEGVPQLLKLSDAEFAQELLFLAAAKLYELGRLSSGKAAQLAGMEHILFLHALARVGAPAINLRDEGVEHEIAAAGQLAAASRAASEAGAPRRPARHLSPRGAHFATKRLHRHHQ